MNIFLLDRDPEQAARWQCDKHVVKMVTETAQLLCHIYPHAPFGLSNPGHPCAKWVRESRANYEWLLQHGFALAHEFTMRFWNHHKSLDVIHLCNEMHWDADLPDKGLTRFALAMPAVYYHKDEVTAYRNYYMHEKAYMATWKRNKPPWWKPKSK